MKITILDDYFDKPPCDPADPLLESRGDEAGGGIRGRLATGFRPGRPSQGRGNSPGSRQRRANEPDWRLCSLGDNSRPRNNAGDSDYADQGEKVCYSPCTYDVPHWPSHPLLRGLMISQCRDNWSRNQIDARPSNSGAITILNRHLRARPSADSNRCFGRKSNRR